MRLMLIPTLSLSLAACVTASGGGPAGICHDSTLGHYVGQQATQALGAQIMAEAGARRLRWITMGMMITMEYSAERLNVRLGTRHEVLSATCG